MCSYAIKYAMHMYSYSLYTVVIPFIRAVVIIVELCKEFLF